jgi:hypothetical protein
MVVGSACSDRQEMRRPVRSSLERSAAGEPNAGARGHGKNHSEPIKGASPDDGKAIVTGPRQPA